MAASVAEMFQFVATFGPMLGELAARVEYLEQRLDRLEGGALAAAPATGDPAAELGDASGAIDFFGHKIDMRSMLEGGLPPGGMPAMMERLKNWKPGATAAAPAAPSTPGAPAPETPKPT